ncbi:AMP-binding protein [Streptomyces sp. H23]|uniref:AMP-binding protein n=1 Tax=Streptomyces sp. H23 TaxID=2541723 RepID=UPI001F1172F4|nr:AMP-binding protein [Streptomyces sp. H23]
MREQTVGSLFSEAVEHAASATALVEGVPDPSARRRWTYAELFEESEQAARALLGRFRPGERVAVWANNIPEWIMLEIAAALAGLTLVTVNPALRRDELLHVLGQSEAAGVFLVREYRGNSMEKTLSVLRTDLPLLREAVLLEEWASFRSSGSPTERLPTVSPSDPAQIQYTSGTTGTPKGALLHHRGITNNAQLSYVRNFDMRPGESFVSPMPLFHTAGCVLTLLATFASRGTYVMPPWFDPALMLELIESERSAVFGGVPTMLHAMLDHPRFDRTDLSSVRYALSGGATIPPSLVRRTEAALGVPMANIYAQTEASPGITMTALEDTPEDRASTIGRPLPGCAVKIVDPRTGDLCERGETGELCTRGYHVMTGYFGMPEQTAEVIDSDGWLHTGDLASMDDRGYLRIDGRVKEMIIRGGENIYPREIEQVLVNHPAVAEVAVVGIPDSVWGEQVGAFIRLADGKVAGERQLFAHVRQRLAPHKAPRMWRFVTEFPLTGSGKIQKHRLREEFMTERTTVNPGGRPAS